MIKPFWEIVVVDGQPTHSGILHTLPPLSQGSLQRSMARQLPSHTMVLIFEWGLYPKLFKRS